ncbi:MAG: cytochrome c biogenesis protein CcdA [Bacteroidota bacterium]
MRLLSLLLTALLLAPASAQVPEGEPVVWTTLVEPETVRPGETAEVVLFAEISGDWRMYALDSPIGRALDLRLEPSAAFEPVGRTQQGTPEEGYDEIVESVYTYFAGAAEIAQTLRIAPDAPRGSTPVRGAVHFMVCNDEICLPPMQAPVAASVEVQGPAVVAQAESPAVARAGPPASSSEPARADTAQAAAEAVSPQAAAPRVATAPFEPAAPQRGGLWGFLLLAVGAGLVALLTPCVFPMIPLTVSYFLHHAGDRRKAARMAGVYGLAIVGLFTLLGVAMALLVGAAGPQLIAANPWVNLFIGLVLVVFGFSLLGFFELRMPAAWANALNRQSDARGGYLGVAFMSLTLVLVSFSCTVPFVGGLLAAAAQGGWARPLVGMVVFSSVFALPFVLFAAFPNALARLPTSGSWMSSLKGVLGFIEIAAALKFLSNADLVWGTGLLPRPLAIALMIVIFALAGLYLIGKLHLKGPGTDAADVRPVPVGGLRLLTAMVFFGLAFYFVPGLLGAPLGGFDAFLPPRQATDVSLLAGIETGGPERGGEVAWHQGRAAAFEEAQRTGRPVLIDFTGYTCTNCRHMEATVLAKPEIAGRIDQHFVPLQLWTDNAETGPDLQRYQLELTGRIALPTYAVVHPDGRLLSQLSGVTSPEQYAAFLDAATVTFQQAESLAAR